jgi:hypothetical protein
MGTPAVWLAVLENEFVKEWRVYADNEPVFDIMRSRVTVDRNPGTQIATAGVQLARFLRGKKIAAGVRSVISPGIIAHHTAGCGARRATTASMATTVHKRTAIRRAMTGTG